MNSKVAGRISDVRLVGIFFIIAAISSIIGLKLYDPILQSTNFLISVKHEYNQVVLGAINELILVASASGTAIFMYPYLKQYNESLGLGYLSFRLLEVVVILIGTLSILAILSISKSYLNGDIVDRSIANSIGLTFVGLHKWSFMIGPNFMLAINTFIYSYVFFKTKMVPPMLSKLGLFASILIMIAAILELFSIIDQISIWGILLALPIATYEMTLAVWLLKNNKLEIK